MILDCIGRHDSAAAADRWCDRADLNRDGAVSIHNLLILAEDWLKNP